MRGVDPDEDDGDAEEAVPADSSRVSKALYYMCVPVLGVGVVSRLRSSSSVLKSDCRAIWRGLPTVCAPRDGYSRPTTHMTIAY